MKRCQVLLSLGRPRNKFARCNPLIARAGLCQQPSAQCFFRVLIPFYSAAAVTLMVHIPAGVPALFDCTTGLFYGGDVDGDDDDEDDSYYYDYYYYY